MKVSLLLETTLCVLLATDCHGRDARGFSVQREKINFDFAWRFHLGNVTNVGKDVLLGSAGLERSRLREIVSQDGTKQETKHEYKGTE